MSKRQHTHTQKESGQFLLPPPLLSPDYKGTGAEGGRLKPLPVCGPHQPAHILQFRSGATEPVREGTLFLKAASVWFGPGRSFLRTETLDLCMNFKPQTAFKFQKSKEFTENSTKVKNLSPAPKIQDVTGCRSK